ncbi:MAG TPA: ribonuclease H family protein [Chitinophagaceae bacterium]|nr:ribonuclease H family protein [Chitinophagaceae bacterium]
MAKEKKYYTVWKGKQPGVYSDWDTCKEQIHGFTGALYRSFKTEQEALEAFQKGLKGYQESLADNSDINKKDVLTINGPVHNSIIVDAACSGVPGPMEYQGIFYKTNKLIFKQGPFADGTNNIGEFLAIVHALGYCKKNNLTVPVYSDSKNAILWVKGKKAKTKLEKTQKNRIVFELIERAEKWLQQNDYPNKILKWETKAWGENPADFGRK